MASTRAPWLPPSSAFSLYRHLLPSSSSSPLTSTRFLSSSTPPSKKKTVFLPRTSFVNHVKGTERARLDQELAVAADLQGLYQWQRDTRADRQSWELLDGPPYANGPAHTGHAINKILKDFIVKSRILRGERVRFRPGWDCHGLPIELKIAKGTKDKTPVEIRAMAREVAMNSMATQMNSFKRWGISGDWANPYLTLAPSYVSAQLRAFADLLEKGLVYRDHKPVYWSPSSRTALAESELEYKEDHSSTAAYFRFKFIDVVPSDLMWTSALPKKSCVLYALTWTTTPWTLPLNDAISISPDREYSVVQFEDQTKSENPVSELYVVGSGCVEGVTAALAPRQIRVVATIHGSQLAGSHYRGCWQSDVAHPILASSHVAANVGTGCVHTAYAHGFDDFALAQREGMAVEVRVDEMGKYTRAMGHDLEGKSVLGDGAAKALELLRRDVVHCHGHVHSYPYDWRTKKPVIIRASSQWFVDISSVGARAEKLLEGVKIGAGDTDLRPSLSSMVSRRPSWCISRQRVWGVPIPAIAIGHGNVATSPALVRRIAALVEQKGNTDVWWTESLDDIIDNETGQSLSLPSGDVAKSMEIMDVWLDSGLAWTAAREGYEDADSTRAADAILEGVDQFRGWFQSLLLTSVALQDRVPYKEVFVHGFCMDDKGKKMSKSIGNVVDPDVITDGSMSSPALGADGLRLWVALYGAETSGESRIGPAVIKDVETKVIAVRNSLRFLLGAQDGMDVEWRPSGPLPLLDQSILRRTVDFATRVDSLYASFRFRAVANESLQFVQQLSSSYISLVRDRLYCDAVGSDSHRAAQLTIREVGRVLLLCLSPLLPHLAAEYHNHAPEGQPSRVLRDTLVLGGDREGRERLLFPWTSLHSSVDDVVALVATLRSQLAQAAGPKDDTSLKHVVLHLTAPSRRLLSSFALHEIVEMLGVSTASISPSEATADELRVEESEKKRCERCRRLRRHEGEEHCERCRGALRGIGM